MADDCRSATNSRESARGKQVQLSCFDTCGKFANQTIFELNLSSRKHNRGLLGEESSARTGGGDGRRCDSPCPLHRAFEGDSGNEKEICQNKTSEVTVYVDNLTGGSHGFS